MAGFNFADRYRAAGLNPGPDTLGRRQEPFEKLREAVDAKSAVELTRLYFGLGSPNGTDWFRDAFHGADASFSMLDNKREAAVLAACLLEASFGDGKIVCALAPLATTAGGARQPEAAPQVLADFEYGLSAEAVSSRKRNHGDADVIRLPAKSNLPTDAAAFAQSITNDWAKVAGFFGQVSNESIEATKALATQTARVIRPLLADVADLREEVEILWWHIGGWSRLLEAPFSELPPATAAAMAGLDMADLSRALVGPAAARALLQRTIASGRKGKLGKATIRESVNGLPEGALDKLNPHIALAGVPDVCPVLTAFAKARETGAGAAWHAAFRRASGVTEDAEFRTLDLAIQVYRERQILYALGGRA